MIYKMREHEYGERSPEEKSGSGIHPGSAIVI